MGGRSRRRDYCHVPVRYLRGIVGNFLQRTIRLRRGGTSVRYQIGLQPEASRKRDIERPPARSGIRIWPAGRLQGSASPYQFTLSPINFIVDSIFSVRAYPYGVGADKVSRIT